MKLFFYMVFFSSTTLFAQTLRSFTKLSRPEKCWIYFHPFVAKKAYNISKHALDVTSEIKKVKIIDTIENGGQLDAFRHAYWMAILANNIGIKKSIRLGKAHEKGNYLNFKKGKLEEEFIPDSISVVMDLYNNSVGIEIAKSYPCSEIKDAVINSILSGKMKIIFRDKSLNSLNCDGNQIPLKDWQGVWKNTRCLVPSNTK